MASGGDSRATRDALKGLTVFLGYRREKHDDEYDPNLEQHRHRTIAGFGKTPKQQFFTLDITETISVQEYFQRLGYQVQHNDLPCISINVAPPKEGESADSNKKAEEKKGKGKGKAKEKQDKPLPKIHWVPPELLHIDPNQPYGKLLPPDLTEKMIEKAVRHSAKTQNMIIDEGFHLLGLKNTPSIFESLQMSVGSKLIQVPGYLLKPPRIVYANKNLIAWNASWNAREASFFSKPSNSAATPYSLRAPIFTIDMRSSPRHGGLADLGKGVSMHMKRAHGIQFANKAESKDVYLNLMQALTGWKAENEDQTDLSDDEIIRKLLEDFVQQRPDLRLAVVILSEREPFWYGTIKRVCDQDIGLHTVHLVEKKLLGKRQNQPNKQVNDMQKSNLALKFNMKLRGQNHQVAKPDNAGDYFFKDLANNTIVFGADVSHAGSQMPFTPSVAAVVANDDPEFAHFPGSVRLQASTQEMIAELMDMVYHRLRRFRLHRGFMPRRILFFRDGVSEDQFEQCKQLEIPKIFEAYQTVLNEFPSTDSKGKGKMLVAEKEVKLTFVVVGKRHHTRFFATDIKQTWEDDNGNPADYDEDTYYNGNIKAGLLVDQVVTRPPIDDIKDFFLQSHAALKGTARSGHYSVLQMDGFTLDQIKSLTHGFCYNYMRATKGVSYAGPAYYADRLCERGTIYLKRYTQGRTQPPMEMTKAQKDDKKDGAKRFAAQIAAYISQQADWNPWLGQGPANRDPNPWHPDFDDRMFWL